MILFLLFVAVPIIEIALFIQVGGAIGLLPTLAIVVLTAIVGTLLMRVQGLATLNRLQTSLRSGRNPVDPIAHGALILVAGVLLLTPGFFTDAVGLLLLVPPFRAAVIQAGAARMAGKVAMRVQPGAHGPGPEAARSADVIDGDYTVEEEDAPDESRGSSGWTRRD
ncbi:FxsA family protein [Algicella marina]|uniref:FxsA n=1 Tax=Algicella marina TaxID=2683284 RepID=A0A6P1T497_9RHOB|nr:FxsA family protein [Algicella marina]QHQ36591.1 FxsA [Algicella marina]